MCIDDGDDWSMQHAHEKDPSKLMPGPPSSLSSSKVRGTSPHKS
jgi:hypothetical protein